MSMDPTMNTSTDSYSFKDKLVYSRVKTSQEKSVPKFLRKVFHILEVRKHQTNIILSNFILVGR